MVEIIKVGVILGSSRKGRLCPQIAQYVIDTISKGRATKDINLKLVDLKDWDLPMFDESFMPALVKRPEDYEHEYARQWSKEISSYDAFIFIVPQYNWGYPAVLKNAIDLLYHEWRGNPAMIVTYGGHGGNKCNAQLKQVLEGVHMKPIEKTVMLPFPTKQMILTGIPESYDLDSLEGIHDEISNAYDELATNF